MTTRKPQHWKVPPLAWLRTPRSLTLGVISSIYQPLRPFTAVDGVGWQNSQHLRWGAKDSSPVPLWMALCNSPVPATLWLTSRWSRLSWFQEGTAAISCAMRMEAIRASLKAFERATQNDCECLRLMLLLRCLCLSLETLQLFVGDVVCFWVYCYSFLLLGLFASFLSFPSSNAEHQISGLFISCPLLVCGP